MALTNIAAVVDQQGRPAEAVGAFEEAAGIFADLSAKPGKNQEFQGHRANNEELRQRLRRRPEARGR